MINLMLADERLNKKLRIERCIQLQVDKPFTKISLYTLHVHYKLFEASETKLLLDEEFSHFTTSGIDAHLTAKVQLS